MDVGRPAVVQVRGGVKLGQQDVVNEEMTFRNKTYKSL
jgi:hypothetical protein